MDLVYYESYFQSQCNDCLESTWGECFHSPCQTVRDLSQLEYKLVNPILNCYKKRKLQWLFLTKVKHQIILNKPMIVRRIYTKAWDDDLYPRLRFPGITILDQAKTSTSASSGLL